jgi:hypothetical protein
MKKSVTEKLNEVLGVAEELIQSSPVKETIIVDSPEPEPLTGEIIQAETTSVVPINDTDLTRSVRAQELDDDIREARKTLKFLVDAGKVSIDELQMLATETEEPRPYEVLATLITSISAVTKELTLLHKTRADILKIERESTETKEVTNNLTQNNVYFNTAELVKMIREGNNVPKVLPE